MGQELRGKWMRLLMTPESAEQIGTVPDRVGAVSNACRHVFHEEAFVYLVASIGNRRSQKWTDAALPSP